MQAVVDMQMTLYVAALRERVDAGFGSEVRQWREAADDDNLTGRLEGVLMEGILTLIEIFDPGVMLKGGVSQGLYEVLKMIM